MNENLEKEIKSAVSLMATGSVPATQSASESSTTPNETDTASSISMSSTSETLTILDELADRERRCKNLIVYNLEEDSEANSDESMLQELFSSVFNLDVVLTKTVCLGRRNDSKPRPLLACFADAPMRNMILSYSGKLRKFDKYKKVYIAPDRTKFERQKHQKLVEELKRRRSNGEQNLVIRNGSIIVLTRRPPQPSAPTGSSQSS